MAPNDLVSSWETCIQNGMRAKIAVEDELAKGMRANVCLLLEHFLFFSDSSIIMQTDRVKRTFDYEPLIKEYIRYLHHEGLLDPLLDQDNDGNKRKGSKPAENL